MVSVSKTSCIDETLTRCRHCGTAFAALRTTAMFCSDFCRLKKWRTNRRARCEFYSPPDVVEAARALFGGAIDLDPASCKVANEKVMAGRFYSARDDGLSRPWFGRVWINPPFPWAPWVPKLLTERHNVEAVIALAPTRCTTAKYFQPLVAASAAVLKMNGRIRFWGPNAGASPDDGHELFYFGSDVAGFERYFQPFGCVFCRDR
jgi:hypothetical protein